jgi:hypothetical protein
MSEYTERVLDQVRQTDGGTVCALCLAAALGIDRWDVLKGIRELVLTGQILCSIEIWSVCTTRQPVVRRRRSQVL